MTIGHYCPIFIFIGTQRSANKWRMKMKFSVNEIVNGKVGQFVIIGFRNIAGEECAQVKSYKDGQVSKGEFALPLSVLSKVTA